jgi:regulatory protein
MAFKLKQNCVCATIMQNLRESCEIDWYLPAELAYNKRFSDKCFVDESHDIKLDNKSSTARKAKNSRFYNTAVILEMKFRVLDKIQCQNRS